MAIAVATPLSAQETASAAQASAPIAQEAPAAAPEPGEDPAVDEIVVVASRIPGQVQTDSPPVIELNEAEVAAYGASSIADLVAQLAPQTGSGRGRGGRPVFLVNGQRVSNFREMGRYPPEAIRKVEVLPEEVALQFGFPPDARVINFILKSDFASREIEGEFGMPTAGGYTSAEAGASILRIAGARRVNASVNYDRRSALTESERAVIQATGTPAAVAAAGLDPGDFRTLVGRQQNFEANATLTQGYGEIGSGGQYTINGQYTRNASTSLSGIDPVTLGAIERRTITDGYALGGGLNTQLGDWRYSGTLDANRTDTDSRIDRSAAGATDRALSRVWSADQKNTLAGSPFRLPGGEANLTLDAGYQWNRIESTDSRSALGQVQLTRGNLNGGAALSLPITSRREGFLDAIGDLSVSLGGGVDHLSDFGTLTDWNVGTNWRPTERLSLQGSYIVRKVAPGLGQLGNPQIVDVNVPVYDFTRGQTVFATVTTGGNPALLAETQRDLKFSASYDLDIAERANVIVEYFRNRSNDTTESFPLLTPAIEAAFPGRVTRAADGTLLSIDRRAVTFSERRAERIRYGFNIFGKVGRPKPQAENGAGGGAARFGAAGATAQPAEPLPQAPAAAPGVGGGGIAFDPARFQEMRTKFCATPEGQAPDLTGVPERMLERMKGPDGQVDPAKVAEVRSRICSADGSAGPRRTPMTPEQFAALRLSLSCADLTKQPDITALPGPLLERMKGADGTIDQARLAEFRQRICAMPEAPAGRGGAAGGAPGEGAPAVRAGGRGPGGGGAGRGGGGGGGPRGGGMGMMGGPGDGQGRWNLSAYHTIELANRALVAPGGPALDLLEGDALSDGGVSRHRVELEGGLFKDGLGLRLSGNYRSPTTVRGSGLPGSSDLRFGSLTTFDLRAFANLEQQKWLTGDNGPGFWKGTRVSLRVNNILDTRQTVTDDTGTVPLRYQPGLIDPVGRFVEVEFRKVF